MVRVWLMDDNTSVDQREPHHRDPPQFLTVDELRKSTGVEYFEVRFENVSINME